MMRIPFGGFGLIVFLLFLVTSALYVAGIVSREQMPLFITTHASVGVLALCIPYFYSGVKHKRSCSAGAGSA